MSTKARPFGVVGLGRDGDLVESGTTAWRLGATGETIAASAHGEHYEAASRGGTFYAATAVAGVAPGTSITTTAAFYLHNPIGTDMYLSLIAVTIGFVSGTLGGGAFYLTSHVGKQVANPTGTAITPRPTRVTGSYQGRALAFTTATVATQYVIRPVASMGAMTTGDLFHLPCKDRVNGEIVVSPGFGVGVHAIAAAGTTPRVIIGVTWEEVPVAFDDARVRTL